MLRTRFVTPTEAFTAAALARARSALALVVMVMALSPAAALEPGDSEAELLASCEERLCRQILDKSPPNGMLRCDLGKTWGGDDINKGAESKSMSWGFGDAQCSVDLKVDRRDIVAALSAPKYEFSVRPHQVACTVETAEGSKPLKARLAPKIKFEGGKAKKVWIKLEDIEGPEPLSSFVWTTAKLEDSIGIFHSEMIKQINKFVHEKCERRYGRQAMLKKKRKEAAKQRRALIAERRKARAARQAKLKAEAAKTVQEKATPGGEQTKPAPATAKDHAAQ
ncbi:MAG: hypothetical protein KJ587_14580 [Alphaproteobacteria bacterium]|nr:hypothetical protein [Alphaproteobacteria bacterium]